jgi:hypothetical protein
MRQNAYSVAFKIWAHSKQKTYGPETPTIFRGNVAFAGFPLGFQRVSGAPARSRIAPNSAVGAAHRGRFYAPSRDGKWPLFARVFVFAKWVFRAFFQSPIRYRSAADASGWCRRPTRSSRAKIVARPRAQLVERVEVVIPVPARMPHLQDQRHGCCHAAKFTNPS